MKNKNEMADLPLSKGSNPTSRRKFIGSLGKTAAGAAIVGTVAGTPFLGGKGAIAEAANDTSAAARRMNDCFNYRKNAAQAQRVNVGFQPDNGDAARFTDFS